MLIHINTGFTRPGRVEVSICVVRAENIQFPRFPFKVLSPLEAIFYTLYSGERKEDESGEEILEENGGLPISILASLLAYLAHSSDGQHKTSVVDSLLARLLWSIPPSSLQDWNLGSFLSGMCYLVDEICMCLYFLGCGFFVIVYLSRAYHLHAFYMGGACLTWA